MGPTEETPSRIEPCLLEETSPEILDLVAALSAATNSLGARQHPRSAAALAESVRILNCYYSNLIEGHNTTPREIERALTDTDIKVLIRRNLDAVGRTEDTELTAFTDGCPELRRILADATVLQRG
jgi:Fic family protein